MHELPIDQALGNPLHPVQDFSAADVRDGAAGNTVDNLLDQRGADPETALVVEAKLKGDPVDECGNRPSELDSKLQG